MISKKALKSSLFLACSLTLTSQAFSFSAKDDVRTDSVNLATNEGSICLDLDRGDYEAKKNGGKFQAWGCNGAPNQVWKVVGNTIQMQNGMCLDLDRGDYEAKKNGGKIQAWGCNGAPNQVWKLVGNTIQTQNGMCLDLDRGDYEAKKNGGKIQAWGCNGAPNQVWTTK